LPCVPNLDLAVREKKVKAAPPGQVGVPSYIKRPLIKCRQDIANTSGNFLGFASGKRSAILVDTNNQSFIRLKGCGNLDQGFPLEPMTYPMDSEEVRGCQFKNTVFREMHF